MGEAGDMGNLQMKEHFRLEQLQQEFDFVTDDVIESSRRFKIIQLREEVYPRLKTVDLFAKQLSNPRVRLLSEVFLFELVIFFQEVAEFRNLKMLPPFDKEIPDEIFDVSFHIFLRFVLKQTL